MSSKKIPPRDARFVEDVRKLFEKGLNEAAKNPEKLEQLRREKDKLVKPWEDYLKGWKPPKKSSVDGILERFRNHKP